MYPKILVGLALSLGLLGATACQDPVAATAVVLSIKSDLTLTGMAVRVYPADADFKNPATLPTKEVTVPAADLGKSVPVYRGAHDDALIVVRGFGIGGQVQPVVEYAVRIHFAAGESTAVPVFLSSKCTTPNSMSPCATPGDTCYGEPHGSLCPGMCGPVSVPDMSFAIKNSGDEANWQPRTCGPMDAGIDMGDAGDGAPPPSVLQDAKVDGSTDAGDASPDGSPLTPDATVCKLTPGNPCSVIPDCGCTGGRTCRSVDESDPSAPLLSCTAFGTKGQDEVCKDKTECQAGFDCRGGLVSVCRKYCAVDADCGVNGICSPEQNSKQQTIVGLGVCGRRCASDKDCTTGCCFGAGTSTAECAAHAYCEKQCTIQDLTRGCTQDSDCCPVDGLKARCATGTLDDGGVVSFCASTCSSAAQCPTSGCCVPLLDHKNGCYDRSDLETSEQSMYCTAQ